MHKERNLGRVFFGFAAELVLFCFFGWMGVFSCVYVIGVWVCF